MRYDAFQLAAETAPIRRSPLRVTAVSDWLERQVEQSPIFAGKQVDVVHNSIDESIFFPGSRHDARAALGVPQDAFVVLLAGQAIEGIRQAIAQHAVEALNRLNEQGITALLVGHSAARVASTLRTPSIVLPFQNSQVAMAQAYRAADLTVVPSEFETFGRVAAESLLCGTPVVAFATGGLTDVVKPGIGGWLVPSGDMEALAKQIGEIFGNREELARLRQTCAPWAAEMLATRAIAEQYIRVYREAIAAQANRCRRRGNHEHFVANRLPPAAPGRLSASGYSRFVERDPRGEANRRRRFSFADSTGLFAAPHALAGLRLQVSLVLDVGAFVGRFAMRVRKAGFRGKIVSFEPNPELHENLKSVSAGDPAWQIERCGVGAVSECASSM